MTDAQTLNMLLGGTKKKAKVPAHKFQVGMDVVYCGKEAKIVGKEGRMWKVEVNGSVWDSKGKDMRPA